MTEYLLSKIKADDVNERMARYVVACRIGDELAPYYGPAELATALVRNGWTWDDVLRANS